MFSVKYWLKPGEKVNDINITFELDRLKSVEQSRTHGENAPEVYMA